MKNKKSWKLSGLFLTVLLLVGVVIWGSFTGMDKRNLKKTLEEINSFAKIKLRDYDQYTANDRVKSLVRLLDKSNELCRDMNRMAQYGQQDLDEYVTEQRLSGAFITDANLNIELQSIQNADAQSVWKDIADRQYIDEILEHPEETYTERISIGKKLYDLAVVSRQDKKGLVIAYAEKDRKTLGDMSLESVFKDFSVNMNGVIVACKDDVVVSTNNETMLGKTNMELKAHYGSDFDGNVEGNVCIKTNEGTWLGNNKKANIPIIAMTADAFDEDRRKAFAAGMNAHISKPVNIETIMRTLDEIFGEKS